MSRLSSLAPVIRKSRTTIRKISRYVSERVLQRDAALFLDALQTCNKSIQWFHPPNEGKRTRITGGNLKKDGMRAGVPDLFILLPRGKLIQVELKSMAGIQSDQQKLWQRETEALAHSYYLLRAASTLELRKALIDYVLRPNGVTIPWHMQVAS